MNINQNSKTTKPICQVSVCCGPTCSAFGGEDLLETLSHHLGILPGKTSPDGNIQLEIAYCFGLCDFAPNIQINEELITGVKKEGIPKLVENIYRQIKGVFIDAKCPYCAENLVLDTNKGVIELLGKVKKGGNFTFQRVEILMGSTQVEVLEKEYLGEKIVWCCPFCKTSLQDGAILCEGCQKDVITLESSENKSFWICLNHEDCMKWNWHLY